MQPTDNTISSRAAPRAATAGPPCRPVETNLPGPIRMTASLVGHLRKQPRVTMQSLATSREEALVDSTIPLRNNVGQDEHTPVNDFNADIGEHPIPVGG